MTARTRVDGIGNSYAVRAQRKEPHDSLDFFPTPCWATRALSTHVLRPLSPPLRSLSVWEPAMGIGSMALPLSEYFHSVTATDIFDYRDHPQFMHKMDACFDFLMPIHSESADWIVTNPPFRMGVEFIERALQICRVGVAMLVRTQFVEGTERYHRLFSVNPPTVVAHYVERVPMFRGKLMLWTDDGKKATTATSYTWLVWVKGAPRAPTFWIPPSRKLLERDTDWPEFSE